MNPYIDSLLGKLNDDTYSWDKVQYAARPGFAPSLDERAVETVVGTDKDFDTRNSQIEMLNRQIAELEKQIRDYDTEAEMGKYKFVYDADPSTYTGYQQNKRSAAQTEAIRKANEEATKASNAQTAWRQLLIDEETEKYKKIDAEDEAKKALAEGNMDKYKESMKQVKRSEATLARYAREKNEYRNKFNKMLGLSEGEQEQSGETGAPGVYDESKDENVLNLKKYNEITNGIDNEIVNLRKRVTSMTDKDKKAIIDNANKVLKQYRDIDVGFLNEQQKAAWNKKLADFEDAIPTFKKSQPTVMTKEKFEKLGIKELKARGLSQLKADRKAGFTNPYLDKVINVLSAGK